MGVVLAGPYVGLMVYIWRGLAVRWVRLLGGSRLVVTGIVALREPLILTRWGSAFLRWWFIARPWLGAGLTSLADMPDTWLRMNVQSGKITLRVQEIINWSFYAFSNSFCQIVINFRLIYFMTQFLLIFTTIINVFLMYVNENLFFF